MRFLKFIKNLPRLKTHIILTYVEWLQGKKRFQNALTFLLKYKNGLEDKEFRYHLNLGTISYHIDNNSLQSIPEFQKAIHLIETAKHINKDVRQYFFAYSKHFISAVYYQLGEKEQALAWHNECKKHCFDCNKVSKWWRDIFPM